MVIVKKGDCEHCEQFYRYSLWHSGFGDNSYAYCDECGMLGILNYSNPQVAGFPRLSQEYAEIDASWEPPLIAAKNSHPLTPQATLKHKQRVREEDGNGRTTGAASIAW
jgi:hypothetical protein